MKIKTEFAIFRYAIDNIHLQKEEDAIKQMKLKKWVAVDDMIRELQRIQTCHDSAKDHNIKLLLGELKGQ